MQHQKQHQKQNQKQHQKSRWDILPDEIQTIILNNKAAKTIQRNAIKMFYKTYGMTWEKDIENYDKFIDLFCYLTGIVDPPYDYINYFK